MMIGFFKFPLRESLAGAEFHTLKLAKHFSAHNKVCLFSSDKKLRDLFKKHNLPVKFLYIGPEPTSKPALLRWPVTYFRAKNIFADILKTLPGKSSLFFQSLTEKLIFTPMAKKHGHGVYWIEHKIPGRWLKKNPLLRQYLKLARQVMVITVSNFSKNEFVKLGVLESQIQVIYPGIVNMPPPQVRTHAIFNIGLFTRLDKEKGVLDFIKLIAPILPKKPKWRVLVAGSGEQEREIKKFILINKLSERVEMMGFVHEPPSFFSKISILAHPTNAPESFGIAVIEAQAAGIPVIASEIGALPEIITHQTNGILINSKNRQEWINWLTYISEDTKYYQTMSRAAYQNSQHFSEKRMFDGFEKILSRNGN